MMQCVSASQQEQQYHKVLLQEVYTDQESLCMLLLAAHVLILAVTVNELKGVRF